MTVKYIFSLFSTYTIARVADPYLHESLHLTLKLFIKGTVHRFLQLETVPFSLCKIGKEFTTKLNPAQSASTHGKGKNERGTEKKEKIASKMTPPPLPHLCTLEKMDLKGVVERGIN